MLAFELLKLLKLNSIVLNSLMFSLALNFTPFYLV